MSDKKYKIDLHTHSTISHDGGISIDEYVSALQSDPSLYLAITDHNKVELVLRAKNSSILPSDVSTRIIVGEEIMSLEGEIIGLFLNELVQAGLTAEETIDKIHEKGGLVYIPHPLEHTRKGVQLEVLEKLHNKIDIIEGFNARTKEPWLAEKVNQFAKDNSIAIAASSDAHGVRGLGNTYSMINETPTKQNLVKSLLMAEYKKTRASFVALLYPSLNKLKNKFLKW